MSLNSLHPVNLSLYANYDAERDEILELSENTTFNGQITDVDGNPTVGYGFDLSQQDSYADIQFLLLTALGDTTEANSGDITDLPQPIQIALNAIQSYKNGSPLDYSAVAAIDLTPAQATTLLNSYLDGVTTSAQGVSIPPAANALQQFFDQNGIPMPADSVEEAVLTSLFYQGRFSYFGNGTVSAIQESNPYSSRADLWFEIRYDDVNTSASDAPGLAKRMYFNSQLLDLYGSDADPSGTGQPNLQDVSKSVADGSAAAVYRMFTANRDFINNYDQQFEGEVAEANSDYHTSTNFNLTILNWQQSFNPAYQYLLSLFKGQAAGVSEGNIWAAPDSSAPPTVWSGALDGGAVMIVGGTAGYTGDLWTSQSVTGSQNLFLVGNTGSSDPSNSSDDLYAVGEVDASAYSAVTFTEGDLQLALNSGSTLLVDMADGGIALGSSGQGALSDLASEQASTFSFGGSLAQSSSSTWEVSYPSNSLRYTTAQDTGVTLQAGSNDVVVSNELSPSSSSLKLAPLATSLFIGPSTGAATITDIGQLGPAVQLGLGDGNTLLGNEGDTLIAAGNNETFEVTPSESAGSGAASASGPVTTMIGGAINGSASTGDVFSITAPNTIAIGSSGTNTFDFSGDNNSNDLDIVWGGGGKSVYDFTEDARVVILNMPNASTAAVSLLNPTALNIAPIGDYASSGGPTVVIIDPTANDSFELGGNVINGGQLEFIENDPFATNLYWYGGAGVLTAQAYPDGFVRLVVGGPTYSVQVQDFTNGFAGINLSGGSPVGQSSPTLSSASQDGQQLTASASGASTLFGNGHDVTYNVAALAPSSSAQIEAASVLGVDDSPASPPPASEDVSIYNGGTVAEAPHSTIAFGAGIDPSDILVSASGASQQDIMLTDTADGQQVDIIGGLVEDNSAVADISFSNGTSWSYADVLAMLESPTGAGGAVGEIVGDTRANVLDCQGLVGLDVGNGGGDTFIYNPGYGELGIEEQDSNAADVNTLQLGAGITSSQASLSSDGTNVYLSFGGKDEVTLEDMAFGGGNGVQQVSFANGTVWSQSEIANMLATGTVGSDQLYGITSGLTFDGKGGFDYEQGQGGGDTFIFDPGYGHLEINEQDSNVDLDNTLALGAGIDPSQVMLTANASSVNLTDGIAGDEVTLDGMTGSIADGVQQITFADGTVWSHAEIASMLATGTTGNDQLYGIAPGLTFDGKGGSDYEQGLGSSDTFIFDPGYGQLEIEEQDSSADPDNTLALGAGIDPSQVTLTATANAVYLSDGIAGDEVTLDGMSQSAADGVQQIRFADGTTWSRAEIASMLTTGTTGDDQLYGIAPGQTFDGKGGSDYEQGLGGGDTFVFDPGYGQLTINENDSSANPSNEIEFGAGIVPSQIEVSESFFGLTITDGVPGDSISLAGNSQEAVQKFVFADGTVWNRSDLLNQATTGTTGNDRLYGIVAGQTFDGRGGSDYEQGFGGGGDTFIFDPGYGQLEINEHNYDFGPDSTLALGAGIDPSQVTLTATESAVYLSDGIAGDEVTLDGMTTSASAGVQQITFADGTTWNRAEIASILATGTTGNDQLYGIEPGLTFDGEGGSDYEQGLGGGDTFIFDPGYGQLEINEQDSSADPDNTLALGAEIDPSQVTLTESASAVYLSDGIAGDEVTLDGMTTSASAGVQQITFADGTTWSHAEIASMLATGTTGNDQLYGIAPGQTFDGKGGSDYEQGLGGADTFVFDPGYGQLEINEQDPGADPDNTLALGAGIEPSQVTLTEIASAVYLSDGIAGDQVTLDGMSQSMADGVQQITFADGTTWSRAEIASMLTTGTTGDDQLYGIAPGQTFDGKGGSDYEQGLGGGDTFIFDPGYGQLTISENDTSANPDNKLEFGAGIDPSQITVTDGYSGLTITDGVPGDSISILGSPTNPQAGVQEVVFADGTVWNRMNLLNQITTGTTGNDRLYGVVEGQTFDGKGGSDYEQGLGGGDTFFFDPGYGQLEIFEADSTSDPDDTLALGAGIDPSQVVLTATQSTVYLTDGVAGDEVTLDDMGYGAPSYGVQQITFADGTTWSRAEIASMLATGTTGNDQLYGLAPGLTFDGKGGSDYEQGLGGGDTFIFDPGYGQLEIGEQDTSSNPDNTLALGAGIDPSQVVLTSTASAVYLSDGIAGDEVTLDGMPYGTASGIQEITFADGTTWSRAEIANMLATGTTGNDQLFGLAPGQTFDGKGGSDYEKGLGGGDTFIFNSGYGQLEIDERDDGAIPDTLALGTGIDPSQVTLIGNGSDVYLTDGTVGDKVTLDNMTTSTTDGVQQITFADGTTWDRVEMAAMLTTGTSGNDQLYGILSGLTFDGRGGSDYEQSQGGGNTFIFDVGYGHLEINEQSFGYGQSNTLEFGTSLTQSDITLQADDSTGNLTILDGTTGDSIVIDNDLYNQWGVNSRLPEITFSDGSTFSLSQPLTFTWSGSASTTTLTGSGFGANLFNLAPGGDTVTFGNGSQGGVNSNLVNYAAGDGAVTINVNGGTGSITMAAGITQSDITLQADDSTGNLTILDGTTGDSIVVDNDLSNNWGVQSALGEITFSDGSTLALTQPLTFTWSGSASETGLTGSGYGANVFNLAPGGDSVTFGNGSGGGSNSNLVTFAAGDGAVTINTNGGTGSIAMAAGISQGDLALQSDSAGDLTVFVGSTGDSLTIASDLNGGQSTISQISFSDGTVVTGSQLVDLASLSTTYQATAGEAPDLPTLSLMDTAYLSGTSVSQIDTAISSEFSGSGPSMPSASPVVDEQPVALGNTLLPFATTTLADSNDQQVDIATVTLSSGTGSLSNLGSGVLTNGGLTYTASGSAASVQADLQGLTLTPATSAAGSTSSLGLTVSNLSGGSVSASVDVPIQAAGSTSGLAFIYGSADNNALTATGSPDQFAFADMNMGAASISGFDPSADVLQLSRSQFADFSALQNSLSDTSGGAMISIDPNNSILLKNVTVASLHASDFQFA